MTPSFCSSRARAASARPRWPAPTAVALADEGRRTLIVTTDPASNLADVFEQPIGHEITPIAGRADLWAMEIDADRATQEYIDSRDGADPRGVPRADRAGDGRADVRPVHRGGGRLRPLRRLPGSAAVHPAAPPAFDMVIFDTAPTGHTIRLLELPGGVEPLDR